MKFAVAALCAASAMFVGRADAGPLSGADNVRGALDGIRLTHNVNANCAACARRVYRAPVAGKRVVRAKGELSLWSPGVGYGRVPQICVDWGPYGPTHRWVWTKGTGFGWGY
jgi:hypothetical protein